MSPESPVRAAERLVLIDFDGTLAARAGLWGGCVIEVLDEQLPGHGLALEDVRAGLRDGFPWHRHEERHPVAGPDAWWEPIEQLMADAMVEAGLPEEEAARMAVAVRVRYADPTCVWEVFADCIPALERLRAAGWSCAVLSNHIPELHDLVEGLGLSSYLDATFSSALTGYEKPHPEAFRGAIRAFGDPDEVWMIGDNPVADVAGAEAIGVPGILVRCEGEAERFAPDLLGAAEIVSSR